MFVLEKIMQLMQEKKLSARQFEIQTQIAAASIQAWKSGKAKPSLDAVIKIAQYFNVSTDYLLGINTKAVILPQDHKQLISYYDQCDEIDKVRILAYAEAVAENNNREVYKDVDKTVKPLKMVK